MADLVVQIIRPIVLQLVLLYLQLLSGRWTSASTLLVLFEILAFLCGSVDEFLDVKGRQACVFQHLLLLLELLIRQLLHREPARLLFERSLTALLIEGDFLGEDGCLLQVVAERRVWAVLSQYDFAGGGGVEGG